MPFFRDLLLQLNELLPQQMRMRKYLGVAIFLLVVLALAFWSFFYGRGIDYEVLYADLNAEQTKIVKDELTRGGVPARFEQSGRGVTVRVPQGKALDWRIELAQKVGIEGTGKGWSIFDPRDFGMTSEEFQVKKYRAQKGELARTISAISIVKAATVELALPEKELFVKEQKPPKASVMLTLYPNAVITPQQVATIQAFVAGSVEDLLPENVNVADTEGNQLSQTGKPDEATEKLNSQERLLDMHKKERKEYEKYLENKILAAFNPVFGPGHVKANVSVDFDFTAKEESAIKYDPTMVPISTAKTIKGFGKDSALAVGITGAAAHTENVRSITSGTLAGKGEYLQEDINNYNVGKTESKTLFAPYVIRRITASVVVDDKPTSVTMGDDGEVKVLKRTPLDKTEIKQLSDTVKGIVSFNEERTGGTPDEVVVSNIAFSPIMEESSYAVLSSLEKQKENRRFLKWCILWGVAGVVGLVFLWPLRRVLFAPAATRRLEGGAELAVLPDAAERAYLRPPEEMAALTGGAAAAATALGAPETGQLEIPASPEMMKARLGELDDEILELSRSNPKKVPLVLRSWMET
jgi:flagellar M-ring protein FliF